MLQRSWNSPWQIVKRKWRRGMASSHLDERRSAYTPGSRDVELIFGYWGLHSWSHCCSIRYISPLFTTSHRHWTSNCETTIYTRLYGMFGSTIKLLVSCFIVLTSRRRRCSSDVEPSLEGAWKISASKAGLNAGKFVVASPEKYPKWRVWRLVTFRATYRKNDIIRWMMDKPSQTIPCTKSMSWLLSRIELSRIPRMRTSDA